MTSAEALYRADKWADKVPPLWLDITFLLIITMVHLIYAIKFTKFSLTYLKAKCAEKLSKKAQWNESKIYLHAILSQRIENYIDLKTNDLETDNLVHTELWDSIIILRYILRIIIFLCCWVVLTVYITVQLNLGFEYFVLCIIYPENGSFLGLIVLPFFFYIHIAVIRYIIYGIIVSWTLNVDSIADRISYQQNQREIKQYAAASTFIINDEDLNTHSNPTQKPTFKEKLSAFKSPYFMAVHWRLFIVSLSILAAIIGFPFMTLQNEEVIKDVFVLRLFMRYIFIAMSSWLTIYCIICVLTSCYARISTLFMFDSILNAQEKVQQNEETETLFTKRKNSFLRLFCLMDAFEIKDTNLVWKHHKIIISSLFFGTAMLFITIGLIIDYGFLTFIGGINFVYYIFNVLLTMKPRGIYFLWTADLLSLELQHNEKIDQLPDLRHLVIQQNISRHSGVIASGFRDNVTEETINEFDQAVLDELFDAEIEEMEEMEEMKDMDRKSDKLEVIPDTKPTHFPQLKTLSRNNSNQIQTNVLKLFIKIYETSYHDRRTLIKHNVGKKKIFCNYLHLIRQLYKQYWLLILPYNYKIRPLSLMCSGKSISEKMIKYKYKKKKLSQIIVEELFFQIWYILKWPICIILVFLVIIGGLYLSVKIHHSLNDIDDENLTLYDDGNLNKNNETKMDGYPICNSLHWNGNLSVFDLLMVSDISYNINNMTDTTQSICLYFDGIFPNELDLENDSISCSWKVIYISSDLPLFAHLRHHENKTDLIVIRGTLEFDEYMQGFALFNQVIFLQIASWIVPITTILPTSFIIQTVYLSSLIEGAVDDKVRARYDIPVFQYALNLLKNTNYQIDSLYFAGHSMGGTIGMAVAAQLYGAYNDENCQYFDSNKQYIKNLEIKSFSVNSPGMLYNSRKFSLNVNDIYSTATIIKSRYDFISSIDSSIGFVQNVECRENSYLLDCHLLTTIIYEFITRCNIYYSNNPTIIMGLKNHIENDYLNLGDYLVFANYSHK